MKTLLTFAVLASTTFTFAQTDIIEMRSRGRSLNKYERFDSYRISKSTNDHVNSNFGMAPEPLVQTAVLDSIKALDDNTAIVYTSEYCTYGYYPVESQFIYVDEQGRELNEPKRVYGNPRVGHLWQPGADTVRNHPIFTRRHSLDSIKAVIDRDYIGQTSRKRNTL